MSNDDDPSPREYASPPCFMHEVDPAYAGLPPRADADWPAVARWRKAERERLIAQRLSLHAATRADHARRISDGLSALIGDPADFIIGAYWPIRGEPNLLTWLEGLRARGAEIALPVVIAKKTPMVFRLWQEGEKLARGVWNIPFPADGKQVQPDIVIAPVVGFDTGCYRLGYGGGFFDRTLATLPEATIAIGVGYAQAAIPTIHPQPFDIPMRHIVTESGTRTR
ncbi:MAG: 5-formyltetrahydrofolate cyclo-ligase [Bradyrhizobiaceae bacterium]|nr:5-formyltetrahydrofolate cyclo-ligase [Bradyrhizobiaceae bacterium]